MGNAARLGTDSWEEALRLILRGGVVPQDPLHVTALLEMGGWSDGRASLEFGFADLFDMGEELFRQARARVANRTIAQGDPYPWHRWVGLGVVFYLRGFMFAMPMVISVLAMLQLRYSLWSYEEFGPDRATGIAIGTMASFLVTGGFTQAIARRGLFYISQREYYLARKTSIQLIMVGLVVAIGLGVTILAANLVLPFFPWRLLATAAPYYFFLCLLWLSITVMYMMRQEVLFTAITAGGIAAVWYLYGYKEWLTIEHAQMVGLGLSTLVSLGCALWLFYRQERRRDAGSGTALPRWSLAVRELTPYFLFGVLYFGFLFLDRVLAWSVPGPVHPYPIWFLGDYELGLDWAILTLVAPMGFLELFINVFGIRIQYWLVSTVGAKWLEFNARFQFSYVVQLIATWVVSAFGGWLVWLFMGPLEGMGLIRTTTIFQSEVTTFVFVIGTASYVFVSTGLLNCLMMFSLNLPWPAVRSILIALVVDVLVGFVLSRQVHYSWAAVGLLAGSLAFALGSSWLAFRQLGRLDFLIYRSV